MSFAGQRSASRAYDDLIPPHQLVREDRADVLLLELPGFMKEQIKVQIDNYGKIRISGQRPLSGNQWSRFRKDYIVSEDCNVSEIRAKFENNIMSVVMPKLITKEIARAEPTQVAKHTNSDAKFSNDLPRPYAPTDAIKERENKEEEEQSKEYSKDKYGTDEKPPAAAKAAEAEASDCSNQKMERRLGFGLCRPRKMVLKLVILILFFVGMGLFLTYKLRGPAMLMILLWRRNNSRTCPSALYVAAWISQ